VLDSRANGRAFTGIHLLVEYADAARILGGQLIEDLRGRVAGTVVDGDDFALEAVGEGRVEGSLNGGGDELLFVVDGDEDREETFRGQLGIIAHGRLSRHRAGAHGSGFAAHKPNHDAIGKQNSHQDGVHARLANVAFHEPVVVDHAGHRAAVDQAVEQ
jgi:hypothetical protein